MASGGKKKTTMAKLNRESRLRERRAAKQAKKDARKLAPASDPDAQDYATPGDPSQADAVEPAPATLATDESIAERRPPAHDLTTEKAVKHLFPDEAREAARVQEPDAGNGTPEAEPVEVGA